MSHPTVKSFLGVVVLVTVLTPLTAQAQNTNTTLQNGRVNINLTAQRGDSNTNTTSQTGLININRTLQLGGNSGNPAGSFGRFNLPRPEPGRGFQGLRIDRDGDAHGHVVPDRAQRWDERRRDRWHGEERP